MVRKMVSLFSSPRRGKVGRGALVGHHLDAPTLTLPLRGRGRYIFICLLLIILAIPCSAHAERWQWAVSSFFSPQQSVSAKAQLVFAPGRGLEEEGLRFRYEGRFSGWDDFSPFAPRSYVIESEDSIYIGAHFHRGPWRANLYGGVTVFSDTQFGLHTQFGANAIAELLWLGGSGEFIGFEGRASTIDNNWSASLVAGRPTGFGTLKLGPEAGVGGNITGWNARGGIAATGLAFAGYDLALSAGAMINDQDRVSPYFSLWLSGKF